MVIFDRWRPKTALLVAVSITSAGLLPLLMATTATASPLLIAQLFQQSPSVGIPSGTVLPVRYDQAEKIVVTPEETAPVTLTVSQDIRSARGTVLIAAGSKIAGQLRPENGGTRFFSESVTPPNSDRPIPINATSNAITQTETITRNTNPDFLKGAAIGAGAGAILGQIFGGRINILEVLGGAAAGTLASVLLPHREEVKVVVINPATDLNLTLQSDYVLR